MEFINWITQHWVEITAAVGGLVTVASIIAKLTPWEADDKIVQFLIDALHMVALQKKPPA